MVDIYIRYDGALRCSAKHGPSSTSFVTDAPVDNHGKGESFSPTDLVATALGTCMLTTMGILAKKRAWMIDGIDAHVKKHMTLELPRKIAKLVVALNVPDEVAGAIDLASRAELEHAAHTCPVRLSLHPQIEVEASFKWGSADS